MTKNDPVSGAVLILVISMMTARSDHYHPLLIPTMTPVRITVSVAIAAHLTAVMITAEPDADILCAGS